MEKNKIITIVVGVIVLLFALKFVAGFLAFVMRNFFVIAFLSALAYGAYWVKTNYLDKDSGTGDEK